jgi:hypothetical protein
MHAAGSPEVRRIGDSGPLLDGPTGANVGAGHTGEACLGRDDLPLRQERYAWRSISTEDGDRRRRPKTAIEDGDRRRRSKTAIEDGDRRRRSKTAIEDGDRRRRSKTAIADGAQANPVAECAAL